MLYSTVQDALLTTDILVYYASCFIATNDVFLLLIITGIMQKFFSPVIRLLNRFSYAQKFVLLALIYLLAITFVIYSLYAHLSKIIDDSNQQLQGLAVISPIAQTIHIMQEQRDVELALLSGNNTLTALQQSKARELDNALFTLQQQWLLDKELHSSWLTFSNDWQLFRQTQHKLSPSDNFNVHSALIEKLQQFQSQVADQQKLNSDTDIAIYYLADTALNKLPMALEQLAQIRAMGSSILIRKQLSEKERIKLFSLIFKFNDTFKSLKIDLKKVGDHHDDIKSNLITAANAIEVSSQQLIVLIETDIISEKFATATEDYFKTATLLINKNHEQLYKSLLPSIELLLKNRIQQTKTELWINTSIVLLAFLMLSYLFAGIYYAMRQNVNVLARSAKQFAEGQFTDRIVINSRDELAQIAQSVNDMADSFCTLLETQKDSEHRLQTIINTALDAIIQINEQGIITGWNKHAESIFGWAKDEVLGLELASIIIPEHYRAAHRAGIENYLKYGSAKFCYSTIEIHGLHRKGHQIPIEISLTAIKTKQGIEFSAFIHDITDRKQAKLALRDSEMRFRQLLQNIPSVAVQSYDASGIIHYWNKASERFYGYSAKEAIGKNVIDLLIPASDRYAFQNEMDDAFISKEFTPTKELACLHKNGSIIDVYSSYAYVHIPDKAPEIFCLDINLTEFKHSEARLYEKEQLLEQAQKVANIGYYIVNLQQGTWQSSTILNDILGIDEHFIKTMDSWWALVAEEYRQELENKFYLAITEQADYESSVYKIIRPNDGEIRWLLDYGQIEKNELGQVIGFTGTALDITKRKSAEDQLQILSLAVQQSPNSIVITDIDANIQFVNKAFTKVTGYSLKEVLGQNPRLLHSGNTPRSTFDELWATLLRGEVWQGELFNRCKDGTEYVELAIISPVRQPNGDITHYLAIKEDITEKKRAETELRIAAAAFESQESILVTDANNLILRVNKAFTDMTGYSAEEVIGKNPSILKSGQQDKVFYDSMWQAIHDTGFWQGEIWNCRKDGSHYLGWMTITVVKNEKSEITHHVATLTDMTERKLAEEKIRQLAFYDPLTELPNRRKLLERLEFAIVNAQHKHTLLAVLMLDLDHFKMVNDHLGHLAGDELLQQVAKRITHNLRNTDTVARLGGDEFVVLLEDIGHEENAARVSGNIIRSLTEVFILLKHHAVNISTSIGISLYPPHGNHAAELLDHADKALYQAKNQGRACFAYFSKQLTQLAREKLDLENRLRSSISQQELHLFYQAQVDMQTGHIIGAEALVRWQDPEQGFILPSRFIPIAEENGLILNISEWVFKEACQQGRQWLDEQLPKISLSVNVSPLQIQRSNLTALVARVLAETAFPAELLILEITELSLMEHQESAIIQLKALKDLGVRLAIDNFGVGYSSLNYLRRFPLDIINIDKSFIDELIMPQTNGEIVRCIINMGHNLGFKVLAEGVETFEQLEFLQMHGCDAYQGYIKSMPLSVTDFRQLLSKTT